MGEGGIGTFYVGKYFIKLNMRIGKSRYKGGWLKVRWTCVEDSMSRNFKEGFLGFKGVGGEIAQ